jgi:hypothetical protein
MGFGSVATHLNTCDGKPLSKAAERLPKPKAASNSGPIDTAKLNHEMLVHIVDKLWKYPSFTKTIHSVLFSEQFPIPSDPVYDDDVWEKGKVKTLKLVPRPWIATQLMNVYGKHGLKQEYLNALEILDGESIPMLFAMDQQMSLSSPLPKELHGNAVLASRVFNERSQSNGRRLALLIARGGLTKSGLKLHMGGCFELTLGDGIDSKKVVSIKHNQSKVVVSVPDHTPILSSFDLIDNFSDFHACVVLHPSKYFLHEFFPEQAEFKKNFETKAKAVVYKKLVNEMQVKDADSFAAEQAAKVFASSSRTSLEFASKAKAQARTEKARAAIEDKKKERGLKRKVCISSAIVPVAVVPP